MLSYILHKMDTYTAYIKLGGGYAPRCAMNVHFAVLQMPTKYLAII